MVTLNSAIGLAFLLASITFLAGTVYGWMLAHDKWVRNAYANRCRRFGGRQYKVVDIRDDESWIAAELYKPYEMREGYDRR